MRACVHACMYDSNLIGLGHGIYLPSHPHSPLSSHPSPLLQFCTQTLSSIAALKYHVPRCTPTWAQSQCTICFKRLKSLSRLKQHLRSKHPDAAIALDFDTEYNPGEEVEDDEVEDVFVRVPKGGKSAVYSKCYKERCVRWHGTTVSVYV